ncbi:MAG: response regulator transcription factor [Chloroflexi bacterium]|nr:response regulator transcription factor [Chloroflexota bacterium]
MTKNACRVLVVDDEARILNFLKAKLKLSGYEVVTATNGVEALEVVHTQEPDLIVLDLLMPKMNGFDMLKQLRTFSPVPVIILSAKGANGDKIQGLSMGADDYLPKPFNPDELVARIEAVRRRFKPDKNIPMVETFSLGGATIDFKRHNVTVKGQEKYLTRIEWLLLSELAHNAGRLMPYEELLSRVWGPEYRNDVQLLRTWVSRLRYKLEDTPSKPKLISTVPKTGYIINEPAS